MDEHPNRASRQVLIADLIARGLVTSQTELRAMLAERGVAVTQPTLSKDLADIGAIRVRGPHGGLVYALGEIATAGASLSRIVTDLMVSATPSGNLVVVRTPSGAAQYFAAGLDRAGWPSVLGTIAGDDTVLVVTRRPDGGQGVVAELMAHQRKAA